MRVRHKVLGRERPPQSPSETVRPFFFFLKGMNKRNAMLTCRAIDDVDGGAGVDKVMQLVRASHDLQLDAVQL